MNNKIAILLFALILVLIGASSYLLFFNKEVDNERKVEDEAKAIEQSIDKVGEPIKAASPNELEGIVEINSSGFAINHLTFGAGGILRFANRTGEKVVIQSDNKELFDMLPLEANSSYDVVINNKGEFSFSITGMSSVLKVSSVGKIDPKDIKKLNKTNHNE